MRQIFAVFALVCSTLFLLFGVQRVTTFPSFSTLTQLTLKSESPNSRMPSLDPDLYEPAPESLQLDQVYVYVRHGERTPVAVRLDKPPASIPAIWNLCKEGRKFAAAVYPHTQLEVFRATEQMDGRSIDGDCTLGELTDVGRRSTYDFGIALRRLYIEKLGYLPDTASADGSTYFRSTFTPRTMESLQQVIEGLYPNSKHEPGFIPRVLSRNVKDENLVANTLSCPRLKELETLFMTEAIKTENPKLSQLDGKISKYLGGKSLALDVKPRAVGIFDTLRAAEAHGFPVPKEFQDPEVQDVIESACCKEYFSAYQDHEFRTLGMGPLLDDLQAKMQKKVTTGNGDKLKIAVMSCHDTGLAGLLSTLDVFDQRWPDFTASITFELFRKASPSSSFLQSLYSRPETEYFVRMRYRNQSLRLPACANVGLHLEGHPEFCTFKAFKEHVKKYKPGDWEEDCKATGKSPILTGNGLGYTSGGNSAAPLFK
ncbi:hypothetical protein FRC03_004121 [Tulasnella sp. 419]|nr:hypothetical protein FRC03_004121 [Tulasnella sp. 419]